MNHGSLATYHYVYIFCLDQCLASKGTQKVFNELKLV